MPKKFTVKYGKFESFKYSYQILKIYTQLYIFK